MEFAQLASQCARCEGSLCQNLNRHCVNIDCPIFFRRLKVRGELTYALSAVEKLSLDW